MPKIGWSQYQNLGNILGEILLFNQICIITKEYNNILI